MNNYILCSLIFLTFINWSFAQQNEPWTTDQLMETEDLVQKIRSSEDITIIHIGFEDMIPGSLDAGPGMEEESLQSLKRILKDLPKEEDIVLYCGCCPMDVCPNIRPAFETASDLGFTNLKLLDIPTSIKADWLDKGYPVKK